MKNLSLLNIFLIIFVVLKLVGIIDWSWWLVFIPVYIELGLYILIAILEKLMDKYDPMWRVREAVKKGRTNL
jgi:hypothetical protein